MSTKIGRLGHPRIALALLWFIPADSSDAPGPGEPPEPSPISPEDAEFVRELTGEEPLDLVRRILAVSDALKNDPAALQAEIMRVTNGDEIAARHLYEIFRADEPGEDDSEDDSEQPPDAGAEILDFEPPDDDGNPDDGGEP